MVEGGLFALMQGKPENDLFLLIYLFIREHIEI